MKADPQTDATFFASSCSEPSPQAATSRPADDEASRSRTREWDPAADRVPRLQAIERFKARAGLSGKHSLSHSSVMGRVSAKLHADLPGVSRRPSPDFTVRTQLNAPFLIPFPSPHLLYFRRNIFYLFLREWSLIVLKYFANFLCHFFHHILFLHFLCFQQSCIHNLAPQPFFASSYFVW